MNFNILQEDPLHILSSTRHIVENLKHLTINQQNLIPAAEKIKKRLSQGLDSPELSFGSAASYESYAQLVFLEDVVNFCFWSEKNKPVWQVVYPDGSKPTGGWYGLVKCFERARAENVSILDANYLQSLTLQQTSDIFRGTIKVPLLEYRLKHLQEAGEVLQKKFNGKIVNLIEEAHFDAIKIVKLVYENFSSFRDEVIIDSEKIFLLKRAQIFVMDLSYLAQLYPDKNIRNIELLTAFADYKLPQILRSFGVLDYSSELAHTIDSYRLIASGSREELEIRASTIWAVELIRQYTHHTAGEIDNAIWLLSQDQSGLQPFHRTYSPFY